MSEDQDLRDNVALACRILAHHGLVRDIIGHVSARAPGGGMYIRCRGDAEEGLAYTSSAQVGHVSFDGEGAGPGLVIPLELPIHGEILGARPEAGAVVHAHPEAAVLCSLAGIELRPIFGAFEPYATAIAAAGVPMYSRSWLIDTPARAQEMLDAMGGANVCLLRGHGIVAVGANVEQATIRAIKLEALARVTWELASRAIVPNAINPDELSSFTGEAGPIPGGERWLWRHYARAANDFRP